MAKPLLASELLQRQEQQHTQEPMTRVILQTVSYLLDDRGAWTWSLWKVAMVTCALLGGVRILFQKKYGIDWYAFIHAVVSATGSLMIVYLDYGPSLKLTGTSEPLRSCLCHDPLTSLHRIIPAITMGYSLFDLIDGVRISMDFAAHGAATMLILAFFCALDAPQFVAPFLCTEVSTVFLTLVQASFFNEFVSLLNQACFALSFFIFRCVVSPMLHVNLIRTMIQQPAWRECYPPYLLHVSVVFGLFFHGLNYYWFIKIVKKMKRKLAGKEAIRANNDIYKPEDQHRNAQDKKTS